VCVCVCVCVCVLLKLYLGPHASRLLRRHSITWTTLPAPCLVFWSRVSLCSPASQRIIDMCHHTYLACYFIISGRRFPFIWATSLLLGAS
jgi:hypothetical protein